MRNMITFYWLLFYFNKFNLMLARSESREFTCTSSNAMQPASIMQQVQQQNFQVFGNNSNDQQVADWRALDKYVASQLSQEDASKDHNSYSNADNIFQVKNNSTIEQLRDLDKEEKMAENASTSTSSCPIDMWK